MTWKNPWSHLIWLQDEDSLACLIPFATYRIKAHQMSSHNGWSTWTTASLDFGLVGEESTSQSWEKPTAVTMVVAIHPRMTLLLSTQSTIIGVVGTWACNQGSTHTWWFSKRSSSSCGWARTTSKAYGTPGVTTIPSGDLHGGKLSRDNRNCHWYTPDWYNHSIFTRFSQTSTTCCCLWGLWPHPCPDSMWLLTTVAANGGRMCGTVLWQLCSMQSNLSPLQHWIIALLCGESSIHLRPRIGQMLLPWFSYFFSLPAEW